MGMSAGGGSFSCRPVSASSVIALSSEELPVLSSNWVRVTRPVLSIQIRMRTPEIEAVLVLLFRSNACLIPDCTLAAYEPKRVLFPPFDRRTPGSSSVAPPGRLDAHHSTTSSNTCRRTRQSRLVISRRKEVEEIAVCELVNLAGAQSLGVRSAWACPKVAVLSVGDRSTHRL